jgi:hypothetical protein
VRLPKKRSSSINTDGFEYDFVISYAGEEQTLAQELCSFLETGGARVFFAPQKQAEIWGENLYEYLADIYSKKGRFCILLVSEHYVAKHWTRHEWRSAQERALTSSDSTYILPIRVDDAELTGLPATISFLDLRRQNVEEIATLALQKLASAAVFHRLFPKTWTFTRLPTSVDVVEQNQLWHVQITGEKKKPKAEFLIYSHITNQKHGSRRIRMKVNTDTITYLVEHPLPVLLIYTQTQLNKSYWMWLDEFTHQSRLKQRRQAQVTIYVPTRHLLSREAYKDIETRALWVHHRHQLQKRAEIASKQDPNFGFDFRAFSNSEFGISIYPKHDKALDNKPILINLNFAPEQSDKITRAFERGEIAHLQGEVTIQGLPKWLEHDVSGESTITLLPYVPDERSSLRIEYLDENDISLLRSDLVELQLVVSGTKVRQYEGKSAGQPILYNVVFDAIKPETRFSIRFDPNSRNPVEINWYFETLKRLEQAKKVEIYNYLTHQSHTIVYKSPFIYEPVPEPIQRLSKALSIIITKLGIGDLIVPEKFSYDDLVLAEAIAEIIETGATDKLTNMPREILDSNDTPVLIGYSTIASVRDLRSKLQENGYVYVTTPITSTYTLFDHRIELGTSAYLVYCTGFANLQQVESSINYNDVDPDQEIEVRLVIELESSIAHFADWPQS